MSYGDAAVDLGHLVRQLANILDHREIHRAEHVGQVIQLDADPGDQCKMLQ